MTDPRTDRLHRQAGAPARDALTVVGRNDPTQSFDPHELLTPDEVCALLQMKRTWFYAEVGRGALHPLKLGRSTRVRRSDLEAYLSRLEQAG